MKSPLKFESARALPAVLALVLIYALSSLAASRSFAELAPAPLPMSGFAAGAAAHDASPGWGAR